MGYELRVTRGAGRPISDEEWFDIVACDAELERTDHAAAGTLEYANAALSRWLAHPAGAEVWLDFRHGEIFVKNPDPATLAKMLCVASRLGACVVGDDGEVYTAADAPPRAPRTGWTSRLRR